MKENRDRQDENSIKILFFILTRINGKSQRIDINTEGNYESRIEYQHVNHTASQSKL